MKITITKSEAAEMLEQQIKDMVTDNFDVDEVEVEIV